MTKYQRTFRDLQERDYSRIADAFGQIFEYAAYVLLALAALTLLFGAVDWRVG